MVAFPLVGYKIVDNIRIAVDFPAPFGPVLRRGILSEFVSQYHRLHESYQNIDIDPDRIQQVIDNLLDNAIKHTSPEDRHIVLTCELNGSSLEIRITDNESGIKDQDKEKIFEQFVSIPSKYCIKGTGIGLYISREIVITHDGTLTVYSEGEDKGSAFTVKLPII